MDLRLLSSTKLTVAGLLVAVAASLTPADALAQGANPTLLNLPDNTWTKVDNTPSANTPPWGILEYSGMAYDGKHQQLLVFGGGHNDYWGNEVWAFDINSLRWQRQYEPVPASANNGTYASSQFPGGIVYPNPDSPLRPMTRHTYDTVEFITTRGIMFAAGRYTWGNSEVSTPYCWSTCNDTWTYDFGTNAWTWRNAGGGSVPSMEAGAAAYDPIRDLVVYVGEGKTWAYDVNTDRWTELPLDQNPPFMIETVMEYDAKRGVMYFMGESNRNELWYLRQENEEWRRLNPTGSNPAATGGGYGMAYDCTNDVVIAFHGDSGTWIYDPGTNVWTDQSPATGEPPSFGNVHGNLKYDPINNVALLVTPVGNNSETWAYRYKAGETSQCVFTGTVVGGDDDDPGGTNGGSGSSGSTSSSSTSLSSGSLSLLSLMMLWRTSQRPRQYYR